MRGKTAVLGCLLLVGGLVPYLFAGSFPFKVVVLKDGLRLRTDSTVASQEIGRLKKGTHLTVVGSAYDWYRVKVPRWVKVYIYSKYVKRKGQVGLVQADKVNVRAGAGLGYPVLGQANSGDTFRLCPSGSKEWVCAYAGQHDLYAWVHKSGVKPVAGTQELQERKPENKEVPSSTSQGEGTKKASPAEETPKTAPEKEDLPLAKGVVSDVGRVIGVRYRFKLVDEKGKTIYYLDGDKEDITPFLNKKVFVYGTVSGVCKGVPVITVRKISLTKVPVIDVFNGN